MAFGNELDPACKALDDSRWARFERTFCMAACEDDDDCREEYKCVAPEEQFALIIDSEPEALKVCVVRATVVSAVPETEPGVCSPKPPMSDWVPYTPADGGAGGVGGAGGGAGGAGGAGGGAGSAGGAGGGAGGAGGGAGGAGGAGGN